jgi:hypothetical protein
MLRCLFSFTTWSVIVFLGAAVLLAQDTATMSGTVSDQSGAFVQGVE